MDRNFFNNYFKNMKKTDFSSETVLYDDVYNFSIGDPDLITDQGIIDYAYKMTCEGDTHYSIPSGTKKLKEAIINYHKNKYNQNVAINQIQVTNSASHAMFLILRTLLNKDDEVICFAPLFPNYLDQIEINGGKPIVIKTRFENGFQIQKEELERKINNKTKLIIINNPCNPSGVYYNQESYEAIYEISKKYNLLVICDDIYTIFTYKNKFSSLATYKDMENRCIQIRSFSKDFVMTGWRLGYIIADPDLIKSTCFLNENLVYSPNTISQNGAIYALENYDRIQKEIFEIYQDRMNFAYQLIKKSKYFTCIEPEGTFYIFMNIRRTNMKSAEFEKYVYEKAHVKVFRGKLFGGEEYDDYVRLALNISKEKMKEAFELLEKLDYK